VTTVEKDSTVLYHTQSAAVRLFGSETDRFGLIAVPDFVVQPLVDGINADIGHQVVAKEIRYPDFRPTLDGNSAPVKDSELIIGGVAK
jgi:hypothetical protein